MMAEDLGSQADNGIDSARRSEVELVSSQRSVTLEIMAGVLKT